MVLHSCNRINKSCEIILVVYNHVKIITSQSYDRVPYTLPPILQPNLLK